MLVLVLVLILWHTQLFIDKFPLTDLNQHLNLQPFLTGCTCSIEDNDRGTLSPLTLGERVGGYTHKSIFFLLVIQL